MGGPIHWVLVLLALGVVLGAALGISCLFCRAYAALLDAPLLRVKSIEIRGTVRLNRKTVLDTLGVPKGTSMLRLRLDVLAQRLERLSWVKSAQVALDPSGRLVVMIGERKPVAVVMGARPLLMDEEGWLFMEVKVESYMELPYVTKVGSRKPALGERVPEAFLEVFHELLRALKGVSGLGVQFVSEILWDPLEGVSIYANPTGTRIHLGNGDFLLKMQRMRRALREVERRMGAAALDGLQAMDLSYPDRAYIQGRFQKGQGV
ncbi:cell division protein FtsQ/DivIB [Desulfosoma caldarium]|uniref:cell division protein FtsQ/DivIB n=1 Tax=Desulfosoma caldarium TaxID=610254 RepID=UPI001475BCEF|nr:FtsQ-type POTRA domain-containing protein [Desulfosoma caldarium]